MVDDAVVDDTVVDDTVVDDTVVDDTVVDDTAVDDAVVDDAADTTVTVPSNVIRTTPSSDKGIVGQVIEFLTGFWGIIIGALLLVAGGLFWFMRRGGDEDTDAGSGPWQRLDADEQEQDLEQEDVALSATATLQAPMPEDAIVVVEQDSGVHPILDDTVEAPASDLVADVEVDEVSGSFGSLEDTFSSETAINLDQTDPIAEADFHMAYGLYDQAADLINGALELDSSDKVLMSKLCEIYFVWGNRDSFVDAATRLKTAVGATENADWDKIVIMGQQIAADDHLFAGAGVAGATKAMDLSLDDGGEEAGALDMDFGLQGTGESEIIDLGQDAEAVDFALEATAEAPTIESTMTDATAEMPSAADTGTSDLPSLDESLGQAIADSGMDADATAELDLDELGLDVDGLAETEVASLDDLDATAQNEALSDTGINEELIDSGAATGTNEEISADATGLVEGLDLSDLESSGMRLAADETGQNPIVAAELEQSITDVGIDESLLEATGRTQVLSEDMAVETAAGFGANLSDDDATLLAPEFGDDDAIDDLSDHVATLSAPMDEEEGDFDFAKTEALPPEAFSGITDIDATRETPAIAETDVDLDLDDLTAALQVSEIGDTIEQPRDEATVEQPRPTISDETSEVPTMSLAPEDMSGELHEARTMTEVGTKLDLARAYVDMGDPAGARGILEEVLDEGDEAQKQQAQQLLDSLPS